MNPDIFHSSLFHYKNTNYDPLNWVKSLKHATLVGCCYMWGVLNRDGEGKRDVVKWMSETDHGLVPSEYFGEHSPPGQMLVINIASNLFPVISKKFI